MAAGDFSLMKLVPIPDVVTSPRYFLSIGKNARSVWLFGTVVSAARLRTGAGIGANVVRPRGGGQIELMRKGCGGSAAWVVGW